MAGQRVMNEKDEKPVSYDLLNGCLRAASVEHEAAVQLLLDDSRMAAQAALHLARGWYNLALFKSKRTRTKAPAWKDFLSLLKDHELTVPQPMTTAQWRQDLENFVQSLLETPDVEKPRLLPGPREIRLHCDTLSETIAAQRTRLRNDYNVPLIPKHVAQAIAALMVLLLIGAGLYAAFRTRGPWHVRYYLNDALRGKPDKEVEARELSEKADIEGSYSIQFDTCLRADRREELSFELGSDDGSRLYVDGREVISMWRPQPFITNYTQVEVEPGWHHVRVDYFQAGGYRALSLQMKLENGAMADLPKERLRYPGDISETANPCANFNS